MYVFCLCPLQINTILIQCRFNADSPSLANTHTILGSAPGWCQCVYRAHAANDQCRLNVGPASPPALASIDSIQLRPSNVSQHMSIRIYMGVKVAVSSTTQKHRAFNTKVGLMLGKFCKQSPNIKLSLCQPMGKFFYYPKLAHARHF